MNEQLLLMCGHSSAYMCSKCARCSRCCQCTGRPLPPIISTMSRESQTRLRELDRVRKEGEPRDRTPEKA